MAKKKSAKSGDSATDATATPTRAEINKAFDLASLLNVIADHYWIQLSQSQSNEQIESIKSDLSKRIIELTHTLTPTLESVIRDPVTLVEMGGRSFRTAHSAALEFAGSVLRYLYGHGDPVTKRVPRHSEWSMDRLDKLIEVERNRGLRAQKQWTDWRAPKVAMTWFEIASRSWTNFANKLRDEGKLKNHPVSDDRMVSIHRSIFARHGLDLPLGVELIEL